MTASRTSSTSGRECVFCGGGPVVLTRVINPGWEATYADCMPVGSGSTVRGVCARCRDGWIDELDATAAPHLRPLFDGVAHDVTPEAADLVARWVATTAVLVEQGQLPRTRPTVTAEQGEALRTGRQPDCFAEFDFPLDEADVLDARSTGTQMRTPNGHRPTSSLSDTSWGVVSITFRRLHVVCLHAASPAMMMLMDYAGVVEFLGVQNQIPTRDGVLWPQSRPQLTRTEAAGYHEAILHLMDKGLQALNHRRPRVLSARSPAEGP